MSREGFASNYNSDEQAKLQRPGCRCSIQQLELVGCDCDSKAPEDWLARGLDYKGRKIQPGQTERADLRFKIEALGDTELAAEIANWKAVQLSAIPGPTRWEATRRLRFLRNEAKRRGWVGV